MAVLPFLPSVDCEPLHGADFHRWLITEVLRSPLRQMFDDHWVHVHRWRQLRRLLMVSPFGSAAVAAVAAAGGAAPWGAVPAAASVVASVAVLVAVAARRLRRRFVSEATEQVVGGVLWRLKDFPSRAGLTEHRERILARGASWALKYYPDEPPGGWNPPRFWHSLV